MTPPTSDADEEDDQRERQRADEVVLAEIVEPAGEVAERPVLDEHAGGAAQPDEPGERHDQRRQSELGDAPPLHEPGERADGDGDEDRDEERHRPPSCSFASTAALRPIVDATDRSISPDTMTNVIITAMITFSIDSWKRLTRLLTPT